MPTAEDKQLTALQVITAYRVLTYNSLLSPQEQKSIQKKINSKYGKYLSPLRKTS